MAKSLNLKDKGARARTFVTGLPGTVRRNKGKVGAGAGVGAAVAAVVTLLVRRRNGRRSS